MDNKKVYPEWVQRHKERGTSIKKVGENYYLYKHSSKRVPGKKNPVPVDTYIGRITPEGVIRGTKKKVDANDSDIIVKEFGFSRAVRHLCTPGWREPLGSVWKEVLDYIILKESPESYIRDEYPDFISLAPHIQPGIQKTSLARRIKQEYGVEWKDLHLLSTVYLVSFSGKKAISKISDEQRLLLEKIGLKMEVD